MICKNYSLPTFYVIVNREQLSTTQQELNRMREEYAETVPYREHDSLTTKYCDATKTINTLKIEHEALQESFNRILGKAWSRNLLNY